MGVPAADWDLPDRYEVIEVLGRGGGGIVLRAHDAILHRDVAIKLLHEGDADLIREAQIIANLDHPNIVRVHEVAEDGRFIVMELVHGRSLAGLNEAMPADEVRRIGRAVLQALDHAHARGVTHRDVKPSNVLLAGDGTVKLADFGIAKGALDPTSSGLVRGTPAYMAPEQARGRFDARSDIYGLGATLFELATGRRLHAREASETDPFGAVLAATGDHGLATAIARAVEERPAARFPNAESCLAALQERGRWVTRRPRLISLLVSVFVGALAGWLYPLEPATTATSTTLAILPFEHDEELSALAGALEHRLALELREDDTLLVIPARRLREVTQAEIPTTDELIETGSQLGASAFVRGRVRASGTAVRLELTLEGSDFRRSATLQQDAALDQLVAWARELHDAIDVTPVDRLDAVELGEAALARHDINAALHHLSDAVEESPRNARALYSLAIARWWAGRPASVVRATIASALAADELQPAQRGFLRGLGAFLEGRYDFAADTFLREIRSHPNDVHLRYGLFESQFHGGHPEEAIAAHAELRRIQPHFSLGIAHVVDYLATQRRGDELTFLESWDLETKPFWWDQLPLARGDLDTAIRRAQQRSLEHRLLVHEATGLKMLAGLYLLSGDPALAAASVDALDERDAAIVHAAIAARRGEDQTLDVILDDRNEHGAHAHFYQWLDAVAFVHPRADDELRARLLDELDAFIRDDHTHDIRARVGRLLLSERDLDLHRVSPLPEEALVAEAIGAEHSGDWSSAAMAWRNASEVSPDGTFAMVELYRAARAHRRAHQREELVDTCDRVLNPGRFRWSWATHAPDCARWSIDALQALGRSDEASVLQRHEAAYR